jgi:hypothetical protein
LKWPWRRQSSTLTFYGFEFLVTWYYRQNPATKRSASSVDVTAADPAAEKRTRSKNVRFDEEKNCFY